MALFNVGDRVKYISGNHGDSAWNPLWGGAQGKMQGTVTEVDSPFPIRVDWKNGEYNTYNVNDLEKLTPSDETISQKAKSMLNELTNALKRLFDKEQQVLYRAGYIDAQGQVTGEGREELEAISLEANKEKLVASAQEKIAEAKESK